MARVKHKLLTLLLLALVASTAIAQEGNPTENLVVNPSFEEYVDCPKKIDALGVLTIVDGWFQPTAGSADYFNVCGSRDCGVPNNKLGIQEAYDGNGYCGIYCSKTEYREYLQTQLTRPLRQGAVYHISFMVSLSEYSSGAVATLGALVTKERPQDTVKGLLMGKNYRSLGNGITQTISTHYIPQVVNPYDSILLDTRGWVEIAGDFTAQGGEEYLTLGNFLPLSKSNYADHDSLVYLLPGAYYYIDAVKLTYVGEAPDKTEEEKEEPAEEEHETPALKKGSTIVLENIFFDTDKSLLLQQSYKELLQLLTILQEHPGMRIEIGGHTDSRGSNEHNLRLSENRAKAVVDFLTRKGIDPKRLQYKGYGSSIPIDSNATEEGRAKNRRVAFTILSL